ncbi:hypothetical protein MKW98_016336 [Papaver atlanticum]|uniref:Uncharacterized protein n=1 Tax=Papaver atlanticum TaxID=357466 RepID=A0AAD4SIM9_9MAGN|nr:hypothetical protein MKW98_016336 [Papaver atlanticum]
MGQCFHGKRFLCQERQRLNLVDGIQEIDVLSLGRFGSFHEAVGAGLMVFQHFGVSFYLSHVFISAGKIHLVQLFLIIHNVHNLFTCWV